MILRLSQPSLGGEAGWLGLSLAITFSQILELGNCPYDYDKVYVGQE